MADMLAATLKLPDAPLVMAGVTLELAAPMMRLSLRGRNADGLSRRAGLALPTRIGDYRDGVAMLGPDEWLAILPLDQNPPPQGEDCGPASIVDVSSRAIGIVVSGPGVAEVINAGCPLDLGRMAPGRATRTLFETVEIILIRETELRFHIDVWRSFAPWLFAALTAAASAP